MVDWTSWLNYGFMKNALLAICIITPLFGLLGTMYRQIYGNVMIKEHTPKGCAPFAICVNLCPCTEGVARTSVSEGNLFHTVGRGLAPAASREATLASLTGSAAALGH